MALNKKSFSLLEYFLDATQLGVCLLLRNLLHWAWGSPLPETHSSLPAYLTHLLPSAAAAFWGATGLWKGQRAWRGDTASVPRHQAIKLGSVN